MSVLKCMGPASHTHSALRIFVIAHDSGNLHLPHYNVVGRSSWQNVPMQLICTSYTGDACLESKSLSMLHATAEGVACQTFQRTRTSLHFIGYIYAIASSEDENSRRRSLQETATASKRLNRCERTQDRRC